MGRPEILNRMVERISHIRSDLNFFVNAMLICYCRFQIFELCYISEGFTSCEI
jgi:hypothetical protein